MNDQTHLSIRIEPELRAALKALAAEQDRSVAYIIRAACLRYVSESQPTRSSAPSR